MKQVGYSGLQELTKGQKVFYLAGMGKHRLEAFVEVAKSIPSGATGAMVRIDEIFYKGCDVSDTRVGEIIIAGPRELYIHDFEGVLHLLRDVQPLNLSEGHLSAETAPGIAKRIYDMLYGASFTVILSRQKDDDEEEHSYHHSALTGISPFIVNTLEYGFVIHSSGPDGHCSVPFLAPPKCNGISYVKLGENRVEVQSEISDQSGIWEATWNGKYGATIVVD